MKYICIKSNILIHKIIFLYNFIQVKLALNGWAGEDLSELTPEQLEGIKWDPGVIEVYPRLKEFEALCELKKVKFPIEHIQERKSCLSKTAVIESFGVEYLT